MSIYHHHRRSRIAVVAFVVAVAAVTDLTAASARERGPSHQVAVDGPDVVVQRLWMTPEHAETGESVRFLAEIVNVGNVSTQNNVAHEVRFAVDGQVVSAPAASTSSLLPQQTRQVTSDWITLSAGMHSVLASFDPSNVIPETNDANNTIGGSVEVLTEERLATQVEFQWGTSPSGDHESLAVEGDGDGVQLNSRIASTYFQQTQFSAFYDGVPNSAQVIRVLATNNVLDAGDACNLRIFLFNWQTNAYDLIGGQPINANPTHSAYFARGSLSQYVTGQSGDGSVRVMVRCLIQGPAFRFNGDYLTLAYS